MKRHLVIALLGFGCSVIALGQGTPQNADRKQLDRLENQYAAAKASFKKQPSAGARRDLVISIDKLATATMTSEVLDARMRYPKALGLYQEALVLSPHNEEAQNNASMIDSVYHGMIARAQQKLKANPKDSAAAAQLARFTGIYRRIHRPLP